MDIAHLTLSLSLAKANNVPFFIISYALIINSWIKYHFDIYTSSSRANHEQVLSLPFFKKIIIFI